MAKASDNADSREAAKAIYLAERGRISCPKLAQAVLAAGHPHFTSATINLWRKQYRWDDMLAPVEEPNLITRAARGRELQTLLASRGGEFALLDDVYKEMILASSSVTEKLLAWAMAIDPKKMKPEDALAIMKNVPLLVDRAMKLREQVNDFRWRGAATTMSPAGSDPKALDGEIMPPDPEKGTNGTGDGKERNNRKTDESEADAHSVQPALSDALSAIARARKAAPSLVRDVAPKARQSIRG